MGWVNRRLSDFSNIFNELKVLLAIGLKFEPFYALGQDPETITDHRSGSGKETGVTLILTSLRWSQEPYIDPDIVICITCAS